MDGHLTYIPFGDKWTHDISTTTEKEMQLWQEITMLRHKSNNSIYGKVVTAPYIDQAKTYYQDARKSHWKSSGLLYYYSFLNLAKAFIVSKRSLPASYLKSTSIYHGLQANPQNPAEIINFNINIHPPISNNKKNIFSLFYEKLTGHNWPFTNTINIPLSDILGYCDEISHELNSFYGTEKKGFHLQSLIRNEGNLIWFELVIPDQHINILKDSLGEAIGKITPFNNMSNQDRNVWNRAYNRNPLSLTGYSLVRINEISDDSTTKDKSYQEINENVVTLFKDYIIANPVQDFNTENFWMFTPKATLNGVKLTWHPLLSNYLFAFTLSTILRYHPHMFSNDNKNSFVAEAWCNQSPEITVRYFLMNLTTPPLRIN